MLYMLLDDLVERSTLVMLLNSIYFSTIFIAMVVCGILIWRRLLALGYDPIRLKIYMAVFFIATYPLGFVSSRITNMFYYPQRLWSLDFFFKQMFERSYETFHAGLILPVIFLSIVAFFMKYRVWEILDAIFLNVPLCHAIGRSACLLVGCCWGHPVSFTVMGTAHEFKNPVPLFAIILNILLFFILKSVYRKVYCRSDKQVFSGLIFSLYFILYGGLRFFMETIRTERIVAWEMTQAQIAMIVYAAIGGFIFAKIGWRWYAGKIT